MLVQYGMTLTGSLTSPYSSKNAFLLRWIVSMTLVRMVCISVCVCVCICECVCVCRCQCSGANGGPKVGFNACVSICYRSGCAGVPALWAPLWAAACGSAAVTVGGIQWVVFYPEVPFTDAVSTGPALRAKLCSHTHTHTQSHTIPL